MATELQRQRLRLDMGLAAIDITSLSDVDADALFVEAAETYTDAASILASTRVLAISRMMMQAASAVDYVQNETSEKASQRYKHLEKELAKWQKRLDAAVAVTAGGSARFGRTTRKPARIKEYPGDYGWGW